MKTFAATPNQSFASITLLRFKTISYLICAVVLAACSGENSVDESSVNIATNQSNNELDRAKPCSTSDYNAWSDVAGGDPQISLTSISTGVRVSWPSYPECHEGGIAVSGYELSFDAGGNFIEIYSGSSTSFDFANGSTASCFRVRAYDGRRNNRSYTNYLEHNNCGNGNVNNPPVAVISGTVELVLGSAGTVAATYSGADSYDPDGENIASYQWSVTPSAASISSTTDVSTEITFDTVGSYEIALTVMDAEGATDIGTRTISVTDGSGGTDAVAATMGSWSPVVDWPLIGIHTILLPDGKVLSFGTDDLGTQGAQYFYDVWDPVSDVHQTLTNTTGVDFFCSAPLVMADSGDVLMPGGDARYGEGFNKGIVNSPIYHTADNSVSYDPSLDMAFARWYPSSTLLDDGSVLVIGGIDENGNTSVTPEVFDPTAITSSEGPWRSLLNASIQSLVDKDKISYFYPRQWVIPGWGGQVFGYAQKTMFSIDPNATNGMGTFREIGSIPITTWGHYSSAAMYEPGKILQVGGNGSGRNAGLGAAVFDFTGKPAGAAPDVTSNTANFMSVKRKAWLNATVLPTGSVFVNGGSAAVNKLTGDVITAEMWDPATASFSTMAVAEKARLYHSTSLLLPDGRVLVAGGGAPGPQTNLNAEIYSPPYLFNSDGSRKQGAERPSITSLSSTQLSFGDDLVVQYSGPNVTNASLLKLGAVTHSINLEQRRVPVTFTGSGNTLTVAMPTDATVATPGYYMVFLMDQSGTPSTAKIIRLN